MAFAYDGKGSHYPIVLITFLTLLLVPFTYTFTKRVIRNLSNLSTVGQHDDGEPRSTIHQRRSLRRTFLSPSFCLQLLLLSLGWLTILRHHTNLNHQAIRVWNPFQILGISPHASPSQIKRNYKLRCVANHPDKRRNVSRAKAEVDFIEITQAYKVLTDPIVRENYKKFGHADGAQKVIRRLMLPRSLVSNENWAQGWVFGWVVILCLIVPAGIGVWRARCLNEPRGGIHVADLYELFLVDKQGYLLDLDEIVKGISKCQAVRDVVQKHRFLGYRKSGYSIGENAEDTQMAEMLIHAHIQNRLLPWALENLKEDLLVLYTTLASHLLKITTPTQLNMIITLITLLQKLQVKYDPSGDSLDSTSPKLHIWNERFQVPGETAVQVDSQVEFTFNAQTHHLDEPFQPPKVEAHDLEDDLDTDIDTLYATMQQTMSRSLSRLEEQEPERLHSQPRWWIFFSCQNTSGCRLLSRPRLFSNREKGYPQRVKVKFITPSQPGRLYLTLHIMSELYTVNGTDFTQNYTLDVYERIRKFVKFNDGDPVTNRKGTSLKEFNSSIEMSFSRDGVSAISQLYTEMKTIENEEKRLALAGKERPAELVARRDFVDRERKKLKKEKQADEENYESEKRPAGEEEGKKEEVDKAESTESRYEEVLSRRLAIKRKGLIGLQILCPDTLDSPNWLVSFGRPCEDLDSPIL